MFSVIRGSLRGVKSRVLLRRYTDHAATIGKAVNSEDPVFKVIAPFIKCNVCVCNEWCLWVKAPVLPDNYLVMEVYSQHLCYLVHSLRKASPVIGRVILKHV